MTETSSLFLGIISGQQRRDHAEIADRTDRIAGGLQRLGVKPGDSVCILMRNDIAFIEAAYAAMRLGAYAVPINWHFKPEEINYVLRDSGTSVLIGHADMLHPLRDAIPAGVTVLSVPTPPEILANYKIDPDHLATPDFADRVRILAETAGALRRPGAAAAPEHDLHLGHHGPSQGRAAQRADAGAGGFRRADAWDDLWAAAKHPRAAAGAAVSLRAELVRPALRPPRRRAGADAAVRSGGISAADRGRADRHHLHGADHVHPADEAAGGGTQEIRHVLAAPYHPCRRTLSGRRQARDDRLVGAGDL